MNKKRWVFVFIIVMSLLVVVSGDVIAQSGASSTANIGNIAQGATGAMTNAMDQITGIFEPVINVLFGDVGGKGEGLFAKFLLWVMVLGIVYVALKRVPFFENEGWVLWVTAIVVSVLGIRWIGPNITKTILLPYEAFAIAITAAIPFVVWFIIVNIGMKGPEYVNIRKIAWVFFAVIFIGLWVVRTGTNELPGNSSLIYPITAVLAFLVAAIDGTIARFMTRMDIDRTQWKARQNLLRKLRYQQAHLNEELKVGSLTPAEFEKHYKDAEKNIERISRMKV